LAEEMSAATAAKDAGIGTGNTIVLDIANPRGRNLHSARAV